VTHTRPVAQCLATALLFSIATWSQPVLGAQPAAAADLALIDEADLREWLTYLASDELQGRQAFSEGYGVAAQYVATLLREWGVTPLQGDSYLQPVRIRGYRATRRSTLTVDGNGETRTFTHGEGVTFPANAGADQQLQFERVEFVGYARPQDLDGRRLEGTLVLMMPAVPQPGGRGRDRGRGAADDASAPAAAEPTLANVGGRGGLAAVLERNPAAIVTLAPAAAPDSAEAALGRAQAALADATAAVADALRAARGGPPPAGRGGAGPQTPDFTSSQRIDRPVRPQLRADDALVDALLAGSGTTVAELRAAAEKGEAPTPRTLSARVTITIDHDYEVVSQQTTYNVAGIVEGTDPRLRSTYVLLGAHLDHVGTAQSGVPSSASTDRCRRRSPEAQAAVTAAGRTVQRPTQPARGGGPAAPGGRGGASPPPFNERDFISNGADDDASGSAALLAIAKAFAQGPRPRRSVIVVWHAGEEAGLRGSRYNADFSPVPIDELQAAINMDMIGRDDCDNIEGDFRNSVFVVGADRISTDLHNIIVETNRTLPSPMTLDYELNDPDDPEGVYTRSDHYSYAEKGVPVAFFTTGLHPDYHRVSDEVSRIRFDKLARVTQLVYRTGFAVADRELPLVRDNKGPRTGFGSPAEALPP
jgi:hypothetical protein